MACFSVSFKVVLKLFILPASGSLEFRDLVFCCFIYYSSFYFLVFAFVFLLLPKLQGGAGQQGGLGGRLWSPPASWRMPARKERRMSLEFERKLFLYTWKQLSFSFLVFGLVISGKFI